MGRTPKRLVEVCPPRRSPLSFRANEDALDRQIAEHVCLPVWYQHSQHPVASWDKPWFNTQQRLWAALMCANSLLNMRLVCLQWELGRE